METNIEQDIKQDIKQDEDFSDEVLTGGCDLCETECESCS